MWHLQHVKSYAESWNHDIILSNWGFHWESVQQKPLRGISEVEAWRWSRIQQSEDEGGNFQTKLVQKPSREYGAPQDMEQEKANDMDED